MQFTYRYFLLCCCCSSPVFRNGWIDHLNHNSLLGHHDRAAFFKTLSLLLIIDIVKKRSDRRSHFQQHWYWSLIRFLDTYFVIKHHSRLLKKGNAADESGLLFENSKDLTFWDNESKGMTLQSIPSWNFLKKALSAEEKLLQLQGVFLPPA